MRLLNFKIIILLISTLFYNYAQTVDNKAAAVATFTKVEQSDRWVNNFSNQDLVELPIGVRKTINNSQYAIGITKARFTPEYTQLTVFCKIDLPQTTENGDPIQLFFGADDIKLSHDGGIIGDAKLVLLGDVDVPFNANKWQLSLYGGFDMQTGNIQDLTYVTIDCDGFKDMKITGAVQFSRDLIIPLEANGTVNEAKTTVSKKQKPEIIYSEFTSIDTIIANQAQNINNQVVKSEIEVESSKILNEIKTNCEVFKPIVNFKTSKAHLFDNDGKIEFKKH